jgi:hypothetical protein
MNRSIVLGLLLIIAGYCAFASPVPPTGISVIDTGSRTITGVTSIEAQGGNVTELRIDALSVTKSWQGYWGNVTGNIHLDDADNNSFYIWGNATSLSGEIYASRNDTIQWNTVNCSTATQIDSENSFLSVSAADGDSITNTFAKNQHPQFYVGLRNITADSCKSTNVFVNGTSQNDSFYQILLSDSANNTIYTTLIENDKSAYNGKEADFQLMVAENEHDGNDGPTTYYFYTELS